MKLHPHDRRRSGGAALLLVLIAVAMCTVLALSFLAAQEPTAAVASNIDRKTKARAIAESALQMGMRYVEQSDWRSEKTVGTWMSQAELDGGSFDLIAFDDDGDLSNDPGDTLVLTSIGHYQGVTHRVSARITPPVPPFALEAGTVVVDGTPVEVTLQGSFSRPVVVCTPQIVNNSEPVVVRVDGVSGSRFRVWLQRCDDGAAEPETVHYMVMEEGVYNIDGVLCEARRYTSRVTDELRSWQGEARSYGNTYQNPVVFGQVMTANDPDWSVFWSRGSSVTSPATSSALFTGKHVGEDPDRDREDETVGYIVFESGRHTINGTEIDVRLSSTSIVGVTNGSGTDAPYHQPFSTTPQVVVATQTAMRGNNGSWAMIWGASGITTARARLIVDEDTLGDIERSHTNEQVGVIAFERPPDANALQVVLQYDFDQVQSTPRLLGHWRLDEPAGGGGGVAAYNQVLMNQFAKIDSYDSMRGSYGPSNNAETATVSSNATSSNRIRLSNHNRIEGNAYIGPGGDPSSGIYVDLFSYLTGQKLEAENQAILPSLGPPGGMPASLGNITYSSGTTLIDSDRTYVDLTLSGDATLRIRGDVRIHVSDDFRMTNNSRIILDPGASLTLWLKDSAEMLNDAELNADSSASARLTVYVYGNGERFYMRGRSAMSGSLFTDGDFRMDDDSVFFGRVLAGSDIELYHYAYIHADIALPSLGVATTPAVDEVLANDGNYRGDATGGAAKPASLIPAGTAASFDGNGDCITVEHSDTYLVDDGTIAFWFNANNTAGTQGLLHKDASGFGEGGHLAIQLSGSSVRATISSATQHITLQSPAVSPGQWHHVALAFGAEGMVLYLDGAAVDSQEYGGGLNTSSGGLGNREPITIGADSSFAVAGTTSPLTNYFSGRIDDVRLYDQWCSVSQVAEIMVGNEPSTRLSQTLIRDTGNYGDPLHLKVMDPSRVAWATGTLEFVGPTSAKSLLDAHKVKNALTASGAFTLAMRFERADPLSTATPSVIMALAASLSNTNLLIGQASEDYDARVRTTTTGSTGRLSPEFIGNGAIHHDNSTHLAITYDGAFLRLYLDGHQHKSQPLTGDLTSWAQALPVVVGATGAGSNNWLGTIDGIQLYDQAFNSPQIQNLAAGMPVNSTTGGNGSVVWDEPD